MKSEDEATISPMSKSIPTSVSPPLRHAKSNAFDGRNMWSDVGIWEAKSVFSHDVDDAQNRNLVVTLNLNSVGEISRWARKPQSSQ